MGVVVSIPRARLQFAWACIREKPIDDAPRESTVHPSEKESDTIHNVTH